LIENHRKKRQEINRDRIGGWLLQATKGLSDLHAENIIHRDIKPANIFLTSDDRLKLGDLGESTVIMSSVTQRSSNFMGTFPYLSPEILKGERYSWNADIWALGCVLYELLFLKIAFPEIRGERTVQSLNIPTTLFTALLNKY
jgi:serine/threonine protein kinase